MRFVNVQDDKLFIKEETALKIDFKRSKNTFRGRGVKYGGKLTLKKGLLAQKFNDKNRKAYKPKPICYFPFFLLIKKNTIPINITKISILIVILPPRIKNKKKNKVIHTKATIKVK